MSNKTFYLNSPFETKSFKKASKSLKIAGYANTTAKDRSGDIVTAEAWAKGVENFRLNPVLLYQHKHDQPIGRVEKIQVDKKGIFVEASVSEAAEKNGGIQTLIKDGALKSFSVGFRVKDGKYNRSDDSMTITDVELLEISVVSVPCNQESLFSIKKSFDSENDYSSFVKEFSDEIIEEQDEEITDELIVEIKTEETSEKTLDEVETSEKTLDETVDEEKSETADIEELGVEEEEEFIQTNPNEPIPFINMLSADFVDGDNVFYQDRVYSVKKLGTDQNPVFKFLSVDEEVLDCDNTNTEKTENTNDISSEDADIKELHEDSTKENDKMADQVVDSIDLTEATKGADVQVTKSVATVAEPKVAELVEKTGEAILAEADAKDKYGETKAVRENAELKELQAQVAKYRDEIKSLQNSKMVYAESSRSSSQFSEKEMADAYLVAKMLNKRDVFDTKYGSRMKAVTTVDQFLSNFSTNIYNEMEQQLVIAPMFSRIAVDAKKFTVPVADEDTDGDIAMFPSGTYATGIADTTNVPNSNQHVIKGVDFTPHKFMASTHIAKDEEEDTILPLIDFLRQAATRRMARAIDKSILRGTGAVSSFNANPTGYASVISGISTLANAASLQLSTGSNTDKVDPSDIAAARAAMGKYGLQLGSDLVFVTSIEGYNNLVTTSDFQTVDKFGPNATYLTGSVGAVYGIPLVVSEFLDNVGTEGNVLGSLIYKPGFLVAERRGIEIESEYEPRQQVTAMYMSTRFDFKALTTNTNAALDASKYSYAVSIAAGAAA